MDISPVASGWDLGLWKEIAVIFGTIIGTAVASGFLAWKAGRRKTIRTTPYNPELDEQPRILTRKEAHGLIQILNVWPRHAERVKDLERRMTEVERQAIEDRRQAAEDRKALDEHLKTASEAMTSFTRLEADFHGFKRQWDQAGHDARQDRQNTRDDIAGVRTQVDGLSERIDNLIRATLPR